MAKLTKSQWHDVRDKWESDPRLSYTALSLEYRIARQVICARSKKECWQKKGDLVAINRAAVRKADGLTDPAKSDKKDAGTKKDAPESSLKEEEVGFTEAVDKRTDILVKHRHEIVTLDSMQSEAMSLFAEAMAARITADNASDDQKVKAAKNLFWQAKIAADILKDHCAAIKIKHAAERVAWGMDTLDLSPADIEACSNEELDYYIRTHKLPMRLRKIFRSYDDS